MIMAWIKLRFDILFWDCLDHSFYLKSVSQFRCHEKLWPKTRKLFIYSNTWEKMHINSFTIQTNTFVDKIQLQKIYLEQKSKQMEHRYVYEGERLR